MAEREESNTTLFESDAEEYEDYGPEGYHPVILGETFKEGRYQVIQKLGWGYFSTVWMALDRHTGQHIALKIQKSKASYSEAAVDEIKLLGALRENKDAALWQEKREGYSKQLEMEVQQAQTYSIDMIDNFVHYGMNGKHYCSTFPIMGPNLLDLIMFFREEHDTGVPIQVVKAITRQMLVGLDYMHEVAKIIHTDLKPENIMINLPPEKLAKFEDEVSRIKVLPLSMKYLK